jgi:predicted PurR-regulated permease PerM
VLAEVLTGAALAVVLSFFLLRDGRSMWAWFLGLFSRRRRTRVDRMGHAAYGTIAQYVRGLTVVALADATLSAIGLFALGVPLAEALVVLTLFAAYIPTIGAFVVGGLAVATAFASGGTGLAITVGVLYTVIQQVDGNVLQPWVMGSRLPLHPAAVLIALTCGGLLAGVVGALLFVPLSAAVVAAFRAWREDRDGVHEDQTTIPAAGHTA